MKPLFVCPHCGSELVKFSDEGGITIDTVEPIYYSPIHCHSCQKDFVVKHDEEKVLAIIKDYRLGHFYPDGMGLEQEGLG